MNISLVLKLTDLKTLTQQFFESKEIVECGQILSEVDTSNLFYDQLLKILTLN